MKINWRLNGYVLVLLGWIILVTSFSCNLLFPLLPQTFFFVNIFFGVYLVGTITNIVALVLLFIAQKKDSKRFVPFIILDLIALLLIALMLVISFFIPQLNTTREKSRESSMKSSVQSLRATAEIYYSKHNTYGVGISCDEGENTFASVDAESLMKSIKFRTAQYTPNFCYDSQRQGLIINEISCKTNDDTYVMWVSYKGIGNLGLEDKIFCIDSSGFSGNITKVPMGKGCN